MSDLSTDHKKVLKALAGSEGPMASKQIQNASGLDGKAVSAAVKGLKNQGLVESPARCKYGITAVGRNAVK